MFQIFHGNDEARHDALQALRQAHPDGFNLTERTKDQFGLHWAENKLENSPAAGAVTRAEAVTPIEGTSTLLNHRQGSLLKQRQGTSGMGLSKRSDC